MTRRRRRRPQTGYELTLVGELGPVLRAMVEPSATATCEVQTVLRVTAHDDEDLVDVVHRLKSRGLEITNISTIHPGG
jgi:hypothetical protein